MKERQSSILSLALLPSPSLNCCTEIESNLLLLRISEDGLALIDDDD